MLGLGDFWVFLAYILCIGSALLCIVYSFLRWNENVEDVLPSDVSWLTEEAQIEQEI